MRSSRFALVVVSCLLGFLALPSPAQTTSLPPKEKFHLFLLIGQSNMAGRGTVTPDDRTPPARVLMLNKAGAWVPATDPMHFDKPIAGVGLGRSFGLAIAAANPDITVGLIPCAVGGSPIDVWKPGVRYDATKTNPWDDALRRAEIALKDGTLKGILWHQGESDAKPELSQSYEAKLHDLIARLRATLHSPDAPFIVGQLGKFPAAPWSEEKVRIDRVFRELPGKVKHTAFVSAEGLTHKGDNVHFDAESYRIFGRRYADAFLKLTAAK